jgi:hypothetical protein
MYMQTPQRVLRISASELAHMKSGLLAHLEKLTQERAGSTDAQYLDDAIRSVERLLSRLADA